MIRLHPRFSASWGAGVLACGAAFAVLTGGIGTAGAALSPRVSPEETPATASRQSVGEAFNSPMLAADPTNPKFVALAHRVDAPEFNCGLQVSGNGGLSFVPTNPVPNLPKGAERCYAPEIAFDRHGKLYYLFIGLHGEGNNPMGIFLTTSTNHGRTFDKPRLLLGPSNYQVRMVIDRTMGGSGRIHLVWMHAANDDVLGGLPPLPNPLFAAYSDDGGRTFTKPVQISDPERQRAVGPAVAVGADHKVHVTYFDLQDDARDYQGLEGPAWDRTWSIVSTTSADGGKHWGRGVTIDDKLIPPGRVMLIYTIAPPALATDGHGVVFTAWADSRAGDPDVYVSRSADAGSTWSRPLRVNDNPAVAGQASDQYLPRLSVSPGNRVDVIWLDRRNDPQNRRNDTYYSYSTDSGKTFAPNLRLTTASSDSRVGQRYAIPAAAGLVEIGGRLGLLSTNSTVLAAWPDMRNSFVGATEQDVFTTEVSFPGERDPKPESSSSGPSPVLFALAGCVVVGAVAGGVTLGRRRTTRSADQVP